MRIDWNAIPKQTQLVENGEIGDCWRCCIAAVIGESAWRVPHFLEQHLNHPDKHDCDADTQEWLNDRGFAIFYVTGDNGMHFPRWGRSKLSIPLISCGPSPRSKEMHQHHAVVTVNNQLVYDPHPSNAGLTAITEQWLIFRMIEL